MRGRALRDIALSLGAAAVYFGAAKLGLSMAFVAEQVTVVWPPTGIALAAVLLFGYRLTPGIWLGAFLANLTAHEPIGTAVGIATGNTLEAVVGAVLLRRLMGPGRTFGRLRDVLGLVTLGALVSTAVSATIGTASLTLGGVQPWSAWTRIWWVWWLGDALGDLVVAPLLLAWAAGGPRWSPSRLLEAGSLVLGLTAVSLVVFAGQLPAVDSGHPLEYLVFPFVIWAAFRFGQLGTTTTAAVVSAIAIWGTRGGFGPFATGNTHESLVLVQFFMAVVAVGGLLLAAVMHERGITERRRAADYAVTRALADSDDLGQAAPKVLEAICDSLGWDVGALWVRDADAGVLRCVDVWRARGLTYPEFEADSRTRTFRPGIGLPGRVWASGQPVWVTDVVHDSNFPRAPIAAREGLHGAFAFPVLSQGEVAGVLESFSREIQPPDADLLRMMSTIGTQIGQFIERQRGEQERAVLLARERQARAAAEAGAEKLGRLQAVSDAALSRLQLRYMPRELLGRVRAALAADTATVLLLDETGTQLVVSASDGLREEEEDKGIHIPVGQGFAGAVAARQEPIAVEDVSRFPVVSPFLRRQVHSLLGVPLMVEGRLLGVVHVGSVRPRRFSDDDVALLRLVGDRLALVVQQVRLYQLETQARDEAEALAAVARILAHFLDVREVGTRLAEHVCRLLRAQLAIVYRLDPASGDLSSVAMYGETGPALGPDLTLPRGTGTVGLAVRTGEPVFTPDALNDPRIQHTPEIRRRLEQAPHRGVLALPLAAKGRLIGALGIGVPLGRTFSEGEVRLARGFADQAALALENAERFEREQAARTEAERANQAKDEFLAMLGHELRNPLAAIRNAILVLERIASQDDPAGQLRAIINRQSRHLARLVDDLLEVSRVSSGKIALQRERIDLKAIAQQCLAAFDHAERTREHDVGITGESAWVEADPARIEQIVTNLLDNAVKYTPPGGQIRVDVGRDGGTAVLRVRDRGIGLSPELLPRVFELFTQGRQSLDRSQGGLGLGLALVRRLVELHGGTVSASSEGAGQGAEFVVRLPLLSAPPAPIEATGGQPELPGRRVLVIEDNQDMRDSLRILLQVHGYEVEEAHDGVTGLEKLLALRPDVALVDIGLPGLDGYGIAEAVRRSPDARRTRLIALTGYGRSEDQRRALEAGFDAHLVKPVDYAELTAVFGHWRAGGR
jgi:signal transduction histidine kinase/integral membrane sensor domain MASE1/CheY-like chemotaxis protein